MTDHLTRLDYPGLPNPRVAIGAFLGEARQLFTLPPVPPSSLMKGLAAAPSVPCWPPAHNAPPTYAFAFDDGQLAYVAGQYVSIRDALLWDEDESYTKLAKRIFGEGLSVAVSCRECEPNDLGEQWHCRCDGSSLGIDLSEWHYKGPVVSNNCYSYARRKRWCGPSGSQPGNIHIRTDRDIFDGLARDGLVRVDENAIFEGGDFIGLFTKGPGNYHFVRLDGRFWTHKFGVRLAAACDADLNVIPIDRLPRANMLGFEFREYFFVPEGAVLNHCM